MTNIDDYKDKLPKPLLDELKVEMGNRKISKDQLKKILEKMLEEYEHALIDPGEAIGVITAESFGEPGTQMSCDFSQKIIVRDSFGVRNVKIGDFVDNIMNICGYSIYNSSEIIRLPESLDVYVPSLNKEGEILVGRVLEVSRHKFKDKLLKLKTKSGREIVATPYHSFVIKKENYIVVVSAKDLKIGEKLPVVEEDLLHNFGKINLENNSSQKLILGESIWEELVSIDYVKPTSDYVYDLSVPGLETFTTFEGIITHNTLNVKHFAGVAEMNVTLGLPRLIEIFDATKNPSTPTMEIYLEKQYAKDPKIVRRIAYRLKETVLEDIASEFLIDVTKLSVKVILDKNKLKDLGLKDSDLLAVLSKGLRNIQIRQNKNELVLRGKEPALNEIYALKEKARSTFVSGVKNIKDVLPVKRGGEFVILTAGTNLKEVLAIKEVDNTRIMTNDIHEVASVLGIEAGRQAIINEANKVITNQGLDVDIRHIMLIADAMTSKGIIRGITRTGMTGEKESVLARASFETPIKHLINAAMTGEKDRLNSVIENVILNQPVPVGTGLPDLIVTKNSKEDKK